MVEENIETITPEQVLEQAENNPSIQDAEYAPEKEE